MQQQCTSPQPPIDSFHWTTLDTCCTCCTCCTFGPVLHSGAEFVQCNRGVLCNVTVDPNIRHGVQVVGRLHPPTCCTLTLLLHCTYTCTCTCTCEYACAHVPSHAHAHLHTDLADSTLQPKPSPCYCTALMGWLANMQAHANVHVHKHTCTRSLTCMPLHIMPNAHAPAVDPKAVDQRQFGQGTI